MPYSRPRGNALRLTTYYVQLDGWYRHGASDIPTMIEPGERLVSPPRPRGRPRVEQRLERVSTRLPVPTYNQLVSIANARATSVSKLVRQLLVLRLR